MITGEGVTLQGATLTQRGARKTSTSKPFHTPAPNVVECYADGALSVTWHDDTVESIPFTAGWVNPIDCKSITITSGTFNLAWV